MSDGTVTPVGQASEPAVVKDDTAPLKSYFNVAEDSDGKLNTILEYLRGDKKEYNDIDLLTDLRGTIQKLGAPALNETVLEQVYRYAKIQRKIDSLQQEQKGLIR